MNTDSQGLGHDVAERLLDGAPGDPWAVSEPLSGVLAAASAPGTAAELTGEEAAVAAFRAAAVSPDASSPQEAGRAWFPLVRLLPAKMAVALATVTAAGGLAYTAQAGKLPLGSLPPGSSSPDASPGDAHASAPPNGTPGKRAVPSAAPSHAALVDLCKEYEAVPPSERAGELSKPALRGLVQAAGGTGKVPSYCDRLLPTPQDTRKATPDESRRPAKPPVANSPAPNTQAPRTPPTQPGQNNGNNGKEPGSPRGGSPGGGDTGAGGAVPKDAGRPPDAGHPPDAGRPPRSRRPRDAGPARERAPRAQDQGRRNTAPPRESAPQGQDQDQGRRNTEPTRESAPQSQNRGTRNTGPSHASTPQDHRRRNAEPTRGGAPRSRDQGARESAPQGQYHGTRGSWERGAF